MNLYSISEEEINSVIEIGEKISNLDGTLTFVHQFADREFPIKVVSKEVNNDYFVITSYPLKRGIK